MNAGGDGEHFSAVGALRGEQSMPPLPPAFEPPPVSRKIAPRKVVYVALAGNLAIALIKFLAAALTSSSAMLSEAVHSLVDTINELLLLYGLRQADRRPDISHPFGYRRKLYFWSFIVALSVFAPGPDRLLRL
jgi:divalent metal cation (Fe/Co/Zn/Cd) transporter